jgi:glycosyltransferase involved in cell wall biosynthesis
VWLRDNAPELRLLLVGAGPSGYVRSVLGDDPASDAVVFTGRVDDPTLRRLYASATVFVFPSTYEGFGLPPLEAMISGTPVVCSDAASLPEVVGDAALTFPAGDADACAAAIARVLEEPELRARLVRQGAQRVRLFTWERTAEGTLAAYREVLGNVSASSAPL